MDCDASEDPSWASLESLTSGWASEVGYTFGSVASEFLVASYHPASDGFLAYELPAFRPLAPNVSSNTQISRKKFN